MEKQTAVEWLYEQMPIKIQPHYKKQLEQAREMEKQQRKDAYAIGREGKTIAEFNKTFKSE
jgi:hypothetical protein